MSFWNNNIKLFTSRFPELARNLGIEKLSEPEDSEIPFAVETSRNGKLTAKFNGNYLHSKYSPGQKELVIEEKTETILILGLGLGYNLIEACEKFPDSNIIVAEYFPLFFFSILKFQDFTKVFSHKNLILALGASENEVMGIIEQFGGAKNCSICCNNSQIQHALPYFENIKDLINRALKKDKINQWTFEKFGKLWERNARNNLPQLKSRPGIKCFENILSEKKEFENIPVLILGAGPSLDEILPHLRELKKRMIIVAVDTALRATLRYNVEPDFIFLLDPQYYAARHIEGLVSPSSILVTESAACKTVFRFPCKKILMSASAYPFGKEIESLISEKQKSAEKGKLESGGSVATSAWDFARIMGAKKIYFSGLDLGFPGNETHIKGSTFEEACHIASKRTKTAETRNCALLFGAGTFYSKDYCGEKILTDEKMKLFAWWFETNVALASSEKNPEKRSATFTLSKKSLYIPGIEIAETRELLDLPEIVNEKSEIFNLAEKREIIPEKAIFDKILKNIPVEKKY